MLARTVTALRHPCGLVTPMVNLMTLHGHDEQYMYAGPTKAITGSLLNNWQARNVQLSNVVEFCYV